MRTSEKTALELDEDIFFSFLTDLDKRNIFTKELRRFHRIVQTTTCMALNVVGGKTPKKTHNFFIYYTLSTAIIANVAYTQIPKFTFDLS